MISRIEIDRNSLLAALETGDTMKGVADRLLIGRTTLHRLMREHGIPTWTYGQPGRRGARIPVEARKPVLDVYLAHGTKAAAEWMGWTRDHVRRVARQAGLPSLPSHLWRHREAPRPGDCSCPLCVGQVPVAPRPVVAAAPEPAEVGDVFASEAARYQRRAAVRLEAALDRARSAPAPLPLGIPTSDARWYELAACRGLDPALFYPAYEGHGRQKMPADRLATARLICRSCPVRDTCESALADIPFKYQQQGVWGGEYVPVSAPRRREAA